MSQSITPELRKWILDQVAAGHNPEAVLQAMATAGWQEDVALAALETTLTQHLAEHGASADAAGAVGATLSPQTGADASAAYADAGTHIDTDAETEGTRSNHRSGNTLGALQAGGDVAAADLASAARPQSGARDVPAEDRPTAASHHLLAQGPAPSTAAQRWAQRLSRPAASTEVAKPMPGPDLGGSPRVLDLGDRQVGVVVAMAKPRVVVFSQFLSDEECEALVALARPRMARSLTVENETGGEAINPDRTSQGMFFRRAETELVARIETRIARLLHWPLENGEGVQVLHYQVGAQYKPHYDYFDPSQPGTPTILKRGGQRVGTLVMYLNNPERGGGTTFPDVGLEVLPQRGHAVFFSYDSPHPSTQTLHGGAPVLAGEKWVATKWLREGEFI